MAAPIRLYIVDNHQIFREGLMLAVKEEPSLLWLGAASSAAEAFGEKMIADVDVVVINIDMPERSGIEICRWLVSTHPRKHVLLISYNDWDVYLAASHSAGAAGFLLRASPSAVLIQQIIHARKGLIYSEEQLQRIDQWKNTAGANLRSLRPRELQILWLVVEGASNRDIAKKLELKENTVEKHITNLLHKLDVNSRTKLTNFVLRHHLDALKNLGEYALLFV